VAQPGKSVGTAAAVERLASAGRLLIGCDFDGTLAPIVDRPQDARPISGGMEALAALAALPETEVALISGRSLHDLAELAGPAPGITLIGGHGWEWSDGPDTALTEEQAHLLGQLVERSEQIIRDVPGALVERKPGSVAVHVRRSSRDDAARVLQQVAGGPAAEAGVSVINGKEVVELCVADATKGTAIRELRRRVDPSAVTYFGDDTTDEDAFAELAGTDTGFKVGEGPTRAAERLASPSDVRDVLASLATLRAQHHPSGHP